MGAEIWIIESLRPGDRTTGSLLSSKIKNSDAALTRQLQVKLLTPKSLKEFSDCLNDVLQSAAAGNHPVLHIEAHGNQYGLQLTNDDLIDWPDLSVPLAKINDMMKGWLVVTVAACSGGHMARTVLNTARAPFFALVGPPEEIEEDVLLNDYTEFYIEFCKTRSLTKAMWALNSFGASKRNYFFTTHRSCFVRLFEERITEKISSMERSQRIARLASTLVAASATPEEISAAHHTATKVVDNPTESAFRAWRQFVFADKYPENLDLFPFPFP